MKSEYHISEILHYSITPHMCPSWTLSACLTTTWVKEYGHLIYFQLQGPKQKFRKLQFQVYLHQAQTGQDQLPKQEFFEIHMQC